MDESTVDSNQVFNYANKLYFGHKKKSGQEPLFFQFTLCEASFNILKHYTRVTIAINGDQ